VSAALWSVAIPVVLAIKKPVVEFAATMTNAGTTRVELLLDRAMLAPPAGAACVKVTVQVLEALGPRLAGLQASAETITGATRLTTVLAELPL
jgi:hypothetical protein